MQYYAVGTFFVVFLYFKLIWASGGDRSQFYINCRNYCVKENCSEDGISFLLHSQVYYDQFTLDRAFVWTCTDECQYSCMWRTVDAFLERNWRTPQFYGKWPFVRIFGLQEPASVFFSALNLSLHIYCLKAFRKNVRNESPCYKLWHIFAIICINGWIWSIVFHARDLPVTEFLDYASAFSMVLTSFYCMMMRMLYNKSVVLRVVLTLFCLSFYVQYYAHLNSQRFDYALNMITNIVTGAITGTGWIIWYILERKKVPHAWKILWFHILLATSITLEVSDFPPFLWIFDAHSLWHLSSAPLTMLLYSFAIDDCKFLRKHDNDEQTDSKISKSF